jgi:integrase
MVLTSLEVTVDGNIIEFFAAPEGTLIRPEQVAIAEAFAKAARAPATLRAYRTCLAAFDDWCRQHGEPSLPARPAVVAVFLAEIAMSRSVSTVEKHLAALSTAHRLLKLRPPSTDPEVREVLAGIRRVKGVRPCGKNAITVKQLRGVVESMPSSPLGVRNRAILMVGFAGALRRSEIVALHLKDLDFSDDGVTLLVRRSKTDQDGHGHLVGLPYGSNRITCPVRSLRAWIESVHIESGPVFRSLGRSEWPSATALTGEMVCIMLKSGLARVGIDPAPFGAHSLRSGFITAASAAGIDPVRIAKHTGHKSLGSLSQYIRVGSLFQHNVAAELGL